MKEKNILDCKRGIEIISKSGVILSREIELNEHHVFALLSLLMEIGEKDDIIKKYLLFRLREMEKGKTPSIGQESLIAAGNGHVVIIKSSFETISDILLYTPNIVTNEQEECLKQLQADKQLKGLMQIVYSGIPYSQINDENYIPSNISKEINFSNIYELLSYIKTGKNTEQKDTHERE